MKLKHKAHKLAIAELIETITIASLVAIGVDATWCGYEMYVNGFSPVLLLILVGLILCGVVIAKALYNYHMRQVKTYLHEQLVIRIKHQKKRKVRRRGIL